MPQTTRKSGRDLWSLGGLSLPELLKRTAIESWRDAVFGQAGRMAFYHFLGIFPTLFIFLTIAAHSATIVSQLKAAVTAVGQQFLPFEVAGLFQTSINELNSHHVAGWELISAGAGALWASLNATWALIWGLNRAYELNEERSWWKLGRIIVLLTLFLALLFWIGLGLFFSATWVEATFLRPHSAAAAEVLLRIMQWVIVVVLLIFALAVLYRFAPNLRDRDWSWSTPGALCAIVVWIVCSVAFRFYFEHISNKSRTYGQLNSVVMLMLWLYLSNAAVLIGGEMNSEIEKAAGDDSNGNSRSGA